MENILKISFLLITQYKNKEIRSVFLKNYEFNLEASQITLESVYKRIYKKSQSNEKDIISMLEIIKILNSEDYSLVFLEDNQEKFKEYLKNTDLIIGYDLENKIINLKFEEKFNIFDIKKIYNIDFEKILEEIDEVNDIYMDNKILDVLLKFIIKKLKIADEILINTLLK